MTGLPTACKSRVRRIPPDNFVFLSENKTLFLRLILEHYLSPCV